MSRIITYREAIREALTQAMTADSRVFLMGQDIGVYGGSFSVTEGMIEEFGNSRVLDTPISEAATTGAAIGAAMEGMRPVVEIIFSDFITLAMDQLVNQGAKVHYMYGGQSSVPMVVRTPAGSGTGAGAQHSQSLEAWLAHVPGIRVVVPATPYDAKGLTLAAISDPNPVVIFEQKLLYDTRGNVPQEMYEIPIGKADVKKQGNDISIFTYGRMVATCLEVAQSFKDISVEVVDLRSLSPLDSQGIIESAGKTGRVIIVHEACKTGGIGGEVAAIISGSSAFYSLKAPIGRVCGEDIPIPFSKELERETAPTFEKIAKAVKEIIKTAP